MKHKLFLLNPVIIFFYGTSLSSTSEDLKNWETFKEKIAQKKNSTIVDKAEVIRRYENDFDLTILKDDLAKQQRNFAFELKGHCRNKIENQIDTEFYTDKQSVELDAQQHRILCLADFARIIAEYEYKKYSMEKHVYSKKLQEKLGQEVYQEALQHAQQKTPGGLAGLIDGTLERNVRKKVDEESARFQETVTNIQ